MTALLLKGFFVFLLLALGETINGIWRVRWLARRCGNRRAKRWALLTGSAWIALVTALTLPWIGPENRQQAWILGIFWLLLMLAYDVGIGRLAFRLPWRKILADFDLRAGNFLALGMLWLLLAPILFFWLQS